MLKKIKDYLKRCHDAGFYVPYFHDPVSNKPSVTMTFAYITFVLACISVIMLHRDSTNLSATWTAIGFWASATVLYMIREINKLKVDLDDREVSINEDEEDEPKETKSEETEK
jgi:hypothetical protein